MKGVVGYIVLFCSFSLAIGDEMLDMRPPFVECDLDLEDPNILKELPEQCQDLDETSKRLLLRETESFKVFHGKLLTYEASQGLDTEEELYMDMDFRRMLYTQAGLHECQDIKESLEQYVECLVAKRAEMIASIDSKLAQ